MQLARAHSSRARQPGSTEKSYKLLLSSFVPSAVEHNYRVIVAVSSGTSYINMQVVNKKMLISTKQTLTINSNSVEPSGSLPTPSKANETLGEPIGRESQNSGVS